MQSRVRERERERELSLLYLFRTSVSQSGSKATTWKYCRRKEALAFIMITVGKNWNCCCPHSYNPPTLLPSSPSTSFAPSPPLLPWVARHLSIQGSRALIEQHAGYQSERGRGGGGCRSVALNQKHLIRIQRFVIFL